MSPHPRAYIWQNVWDTSVNNIEIGLHCKCHPIHEPIYGKTCETLQFITTSAATESHHCTLAYIGNKDYKAYIYDNRQSVCMLLPQSCSLLQHHANYMYQSFEHQCTKWTPAGHGVAVYLIYGGGITKCYVARMAINEDVLLGKVTSNIFRANFPNGSVFQKAEDNHEVLVVDVSCRVS